MLMKFSEHIRQFIDNHHLIGREDVVIVGLSGGADSVALLTVLAESGYKIKAAHCNFHLRGEESMRDEAFCRDLCKKYGIELLMMDFDVDSRRKERGESVEMACRSLRYEWWERLIVEKHGTLIAVGHHREDNVETFFLNLLRGSSLAGLKGMLPRNGNVIRPMLERSRQEITDYLDEHGLGYVTDSTNSDNYYKRNRLRNKIIPMLEAEFPGAIKAVSETIEHLRGNYSLYCDYRNELRRRYVGAGGEIDLSRLVTMERDPRMVLFEILSSVGFNMDMVDDMLDSFSGNDSCTASGKIFHGRGMSYLLNRGMLIPSSEDETSNFEEKTVDLHQSPFSLIRFSTDEFQNLKANGKLKPGAMYADTSIFDGNSAFRIRKWQKGDRMKPFGMRGSKLLSDLFSNAKLSVAEKAKVIVVLRNSDIIWVPGIRCSALFPVSERTESVVEVVYNPSELK